MSRPRILIFAIIWACVAWIAGCGDGSTDPVPPPRLPPEPPRATTVSITPPTAALTALGATVQLAADLRDQNGQLMAGATVTWSSGSPAVATVDSAGLVTAVGVGTATIAATVDAASGTAEVTVVQTAESVVVSPAADTIAIGDTLRLAAEVFDRNGQTLAEAVFEWSSGDTAVATVDSAGLVTAVGVGTATIAATADAASGTATITVEAVNPDRTALVALYEATDGPNWVDNDNWLTDAPLEEWYGVFTNAAGRVVALFLGCGLWDFENNECPSPGLKGAIPPELGNLSELRTLELDYNSLSGPIPPELGDLSELRILELDHNSLSGPIPPELGRLTALTSLSLSNNALSGPVPEWIGGLSDLWYLNFDVNQLTGPIPSTFGDLTELRSLYLCCNQLHGPLPSELANLGNLEVLDVNGAALRGPIPPWLGEMSSLRTLSLEGTLLTGVIPPELGKLSSLRTLSLLENDLSGPVPPEIGGLTSLHALYLRVNRNLFGPLPAAMTALDSLVRLDISNTSLCAPKTQSFRDWLSGLDQFDGDECALAVSSPREALAALYESANGDGWQVATNWLTDVPLDQWYGISADSEDMVTSIALANNALGGALPVEISGLETLTELLLNGNPELDGELPREMTVLAELTALRLDGTGLCAPPHEVFRAWLGRVDDAQVAACPDDYGSDASAATAVSLGERVEGELESWGDEDWFRIDIGGRGRLMLAVDGDADAIALLVSTDGEIIGYDGTGRNEIANNLEPGSYYIAVRGAQDQSRGSYALSTSFEPRTPGARAYLTQAIQSHDFAVPLVAGEDALLRVFVMADEGVTASMPPVRATFYRNGAETHSVSIAGSSAQVPSTMAEDDLDATANAVVPGSVLLPGTEMVVEVDPDGTLDPSLGIGGRIPKDGRMAIDVRAMPDFDVTAVPVLWTENPDSSGYKVAAELTAEHDLFYETRDWLPVADMDVSVREAVLVDYDPTGNMLRVLNDVFLLHTTDGASGYYMGVPPWINRGTLGIAYRESKVSVSRLDGHTIAHEFGHNFSLRHAPCGSPLGVDGHYPHSGGKIGAWGYDFRHGGLLDPEAFTDLMTYCRAQDWISDYSFAKAAEYRAETQATMAARTAPRVLVVRGGVTQGRLSLEPAFVLDAPPSLPDASGAYRLVGSGARGEELFALRFEMEEIADVGREGDGGFVFAIPVRRAWAEALSAVTLSGPEGSVRLTRDDPAAPATALVLDAATGRIRAILRDPPSPDAQRADALGAEPGHEVLFSRGIPDAAAWQVPPPR